MPPRYERFGAGPAIERLWQVFQEVLITHENVTLLPTGWCNLLTQIRAACMSAEYVAGIMSFMVYTAPSLVRVPPCDAIIGREHHILCSAN